MSEELTNHIDELSASLEGRKRPQVANHLRTIPEQTLDALLRIEELLTPIAQGIKLGELNVVMAASGVGKSTVVPEKPQSNKKPKQL